MTSFDPFQPIFSQRDVAACTGLTKSTLDSYVLKDSLRPYAIGGRRAFSAVQMVETAILNQLAKGLQVPPSVGALLARRLVGNMPAQAIYDEAAAARDDMSWIGASHRQEQITYSGADGVAPIDIVFPVELVMRQVFARAKAIFETAAAEQPQREQVKA